MIIKTTKSKLNKSELAKSMGISRSALYYNSKKDIIDKEIKKQIESVLRENPSYGHRRIAIALKFNKKRILRIMHKFNIRPYKRRAFRLLKKDDIGKRVAIFENKIKDLHPERTNEIWVSDFTFIPFKGKFIYLATIMDLFTREIVGFNISTFHNRYLVAGALYNALQYTKTTPTYIHSDQGSEYDSRLYITECQKRNIIISMSKKSSPWENAYQESFYSQFKLDLGRTDCFEILGELIEAIYLAIYYYNTKRIHTALKMPPLIYKKQHENNIKTMCLKNGYLT